MIRYILLIVTLASTIDHVIGQDPHFSQFFMAPQFLNPASVGTHDSKWNVAGNIRQQWGNAKTPFNTQVFSFDMRVSPLKEEKNIFSAGASVMSDQSMFGAFKSTYVIGSLAYQKQLSSYKYLSFGTSALYGSRTINFTQLRFGEQFGSGGFDITRPTGETFLTTGKSFLSMNAGLLWRDEENDQYDYRIGVAAYNINLPRQAFLSPIGERLPMRTVVYGNISAKINNSRLTLHGNAIYQKQAIQQYFSLGAVAGYNLLEDESSDKIIYTGLFAREGDCLYPYLALSYNNMQVGLTYDITASKQNQGPYTPQSFELSFMYSLPYAKESEDSYENGGCPKPPHTVKHKPWYW